MPEQGDAESSRPGARGQNLHALASHRGQNFRQSERRHASAHPSNAAGSDREEPVTRRTLRCRTQQHADHVGGVVEDHEAGAGGAAGLVGKSPLNPVIQQMRLALQKLEQDLGRARGRAFALLPLTNR